MIENKFIRSPLVSIIIPCFNHEAFVRESIRSVIDQDYENIELIIIDDGSEDGSVNAIREELSACKDRFVRFEFRHRPNKGLGATLNEALEWCEGQFFAPVASDDVLMPYKTRMQVEYLQNNTASIGVFGGVELIDSNTKKKKTVLRLARKYSFKNLFLHQHFLPAPTQMLRLDAVLRVGGYRLGLVIEDWSMWLFLTEHGGTLDYVRVVFAKYRHHSGNFSSQNEKMHNGRKEVLVFFANEPLYKKSLASIYIVAAHDWKKSSLKKSFYYIKRAINLDVEIIFSFNFLKYIVRIFLWKI